jgi:hypothetical protein
MAEAHPSRDRTQVSSDGGHWFFALGRMASSTAGQYFSRSGVSCRAALIMPTRASVKAFGSDASKRMPHSYACADERCRG